MRVKHSWRVTGRVLLVIAAIAIAATQLIGTTAKAADPIKVGWVGPLSPPGGYAEGALMKQAAEIAAEELNARGGVLGRPIQVVFADTRGKPEEGTAAAERLISQEKVVAITGEFHSSVFLAEMEVAHKAGIPIIAVDVWALKITAKGYPEVFRVAPNQALIATKYGDWMAAAGFKNVAVMFEKTDGGQSGRDVLLPVLDKHGIKYEVIGADHLVFDAVFIQHGQQDVAPTLPAVGLLEHDGDVLESRGRHPVAVFRRDQRLIGRNPEHLRVPLRGDLERPHVDGD